MVKEYGRLSDRTGLGPDFRRTYVAGFKDAKAEKELQNAAKSGTINTGYRRTLKIAHDESDLRIPVTLDSVRNVMNHVGDRAEFYQGVELKVDSDPKLLSKGLFGWTSPDGKEVVFYGNAFVNAENLSVTIVHESKHLQQVFEKGMATDSEQLRQREQEAFAYEDKWWKENGERIVKAYEGSDWI